MKEIMENNRGVTLIALIVTIIILLILAGITIGTGTSNIQGTEESKMTTELKMVQHAAIERSTKVSITQEAYPGKAYHSMEEIKNDVANIKEKIQLKDTEAMNYYLLKKEDLQELGITNTEDQYIINYKTGEVINQTQQITPKGNLLYISL